MNQIKGFIHKHFAWCLVGLVLVTGGLVKVVAQTVTNPASSTFTGATCISCTMSAPTFTSAATIDGVPVVGSLRINATTATDGTYTWVYGSTFSAAPKCQALVYAASGTTDVVNIQADGTPTTTQMKIRVTRTQQSVVSLIGLTILSVPATIGAQNISLECSPS